MQVCCLENIDIPKNIIYYIYQIKPTFKEAFTRSFLKNISSLLMIPGHMTPLFNKMRRAIYDSVAGIKSYDFSYLRKVEVDFELTM